ncbi:hypothetical protein [Geminocystis sp. NIES-3709]|nr:hypothetical protein [Geminocystis sp. NIES-3709]BAQ66577.1 hypothetical protein GM3709_3342 [Geminocystis sp. NIES-3709]
MSLEDKIHENISESLPAKKDLENFFSLALDLLCIADLKGNFIRVNQA